MKPFAIPVVALGPGSQEESERLDYLPLPSGMHTYRPPVLPEPEELGEVDSARSLLGKVLDGLTGYRLASGARQPSYDLMTLGDADLRLINQVLGEGEVSAQVNGEAGRVMIQESVFAGVWRVRQFDLGEVLLSDRIEIGAVPKAVHMASARGRQTAPAAPAVAEGVINAPALYAEIVAKLALGAGQTHIINLSLLPFSPEDGVWLDAALGRGGVSILSRGYGNCRITATGLAHVWWVQFFNSQDALILNTLEITDVPSVARAADEDLADSRERLAEVLEWIG
jgi:hydrogenase-1 operon protein HyaF